ncbi:MAG: NAD-dependent epimerase/dehydratase family protein [Clostridiales bacterium]|nr:NAD-dependent epimerase/dehydratase family protein [Clostridiales bacterium]
MAQVEFTKAEKADISRLAALPYDFGKLKNNTVLISGGTGFLGTLLTAVLEERNRVFGDGIQIVSVSRRGGESRGSVKHIAADITEGVEADRADYVIHLASNTHPAQYAEDPVGTVTTNIIGCRNLLELARKAGTKRFVLASSVEIYGNCKEDPVAEDYCGYIDCNTVRAGYNESKRASESLCQAYRAQYGVDCVIARFSRVFGADRKHDTKAIAQFLDKAVSGEDIVLKSEGKQRFSYCYVADAVSGLLKVLLDGKEGEAYNISADDEGMTLGDYAKFIASLAGKKVVFDLKNAQAGASVASYALLDCKKLKALGWAPYYSVKSGLKATYDIKKTIQG